MSEWSWVLTGGFVVFLIYYYGLWYFIIREPQKAEISPRNTPPENFSPARTAYLNQKNDVDNAYVLAFAATLIDLAIKGFIRIEQVEPDADSKLMGLKLFKLVLTKEDWSSLPPEEKNIRKIFKGKHFELTGGYSKWASQAGEVERTRRIAEIFRAETKKGIIPNYINYNLDYLGPGILIAMASVIAFFFTSDLIFFINTLLGPFWFFMSDVNGVHAVHFLILLAFLVVNLGFIDKLNTYTPEGRKVKNELEGLSQFLSDKRGLEGMSHEEFEKLLPYSLALDLAIQWEEKLQGSLPLSIHSWYQGLPGNTRAQSFGEFLSKDFYGHLRLYFGPRRGSSG